MLRDHGRFKYSAIVNRPHFTWPDGKGLAFHVALNFEHFSYGEGLLGISMSPGIPHPNTYNWAWREYGNRVGVWRLLELFDALELPVSLLLNSAVYDHCPEVVAAFRRRRSFAKSPRRSRAMRESRRRAGSAPASTRAKRRRTCCRRLATPTSWTGRWTTSRCG
jgi:hypothetical protein